MAKSLVHIIRPLHTHNMVDHHPPPLPTATISTTIQMPSPPNRHGITDEAPLWLVESGEP